MAIINYINLGNFDKEAALNGTLCICVNKNYNTSTNPTILSNSADFVGAGICNYSNGKYNLTVDGKLYAFNDRGEGINKAAITALNGEGCKLIMGEIEGAGSIVSRGNVVQTMVGGAGATRSDGGYTPADAQYGTANNVSIDSLNARDHFAVQALQMLLARLEKDPSTLGENEMMQLSDTAYRWASAMMVSAANARADTSDTRSSETPEEAPIQSLDSNTEKLLNNIEAAIKRTDYATETTPVEYYKKVLVSPKGYITIVQAENDGWEYNTVDEQWEKDGFIPLKVANTAIGVKALPINKISIAELPALIDAIDRLTAAVQNS